MSMIGFVGPVKDVAAVRAFAKEINGARKADYVAMCKRNGCTKECILLAETPMGAMNLVYREAPNAGMHMALLAGSTHPFDKFFVESVSKMAGIDLTKLPPGPPSHLVFEWTNGKAGKSCTMVGAPVPDPSKLWQFCREMSKRHAEHQESRERHGLTMERVFYLHDAKMVAVYLEGDDPQASMAASMASSATYDKWFAEQIKLVHGMDMGQAPPPKPELIVSYDG